MDVLSRHGKPSESSKFTQEGLILTRVFPNTLKKGWKRNPTPLPGLRKGLSPTDPLW